MKDDIVTAIKPESTSGALEVDLGGKILMPGMSDLHCDALEKEVEPRSNDYFPFDYGCAQADKRNAAAGISMVLHAPATLIVAVFSLSAQSDLNLSSAVRLVTANPAKASKLTDRGESTVGKRADLVAVELQGNFPQVCRV